jgi:acyl-CoA hydrolase
MNRSTHGREARAISPAEAAGLVKSGNWVDFGAALSQTDVFDVALAARAAELRDVKVRACISTRPRAMIEADPAREHFQWYSWHFGGYDRRKHDAGLCHYIPCNLGEIADYYRRFVEPVDVAVFKTCPADANGYFNFSAANLWHRAVASRARIVIVEVSEGLPYLHGVDNGLHLSEVDYVIQGDPGPPPELPNPPPSDADRAVAALIAAEVEDGSCLQVGIGAMPNAVCSLLLESGVRDLGIHTEMMTDGLVDLYKAGIVTGSRKALQPGKTVLSFSLGSQAHYRTLDRNPDFLCCPVEYTNLPHIVMQNERVVAINNTTQMDLQGQASSESSGHRHISGTGGQAQFVRAAYASKGGKSFICLSSTYERHGIRKSRIALNITPGSVVTTTRSDMMYVVTEYGIVNLKGKSVPERARAMISLAHPEFREGLEREAREHGLLPRRGW